MMTCQTVEQLAREVEAADLGSVARLVREVACGRVALFTSSGVMCRFLVVWAGSGWPATSSHDCGEASCAAYSLAFVHGYFLVVL